MPPFFNQRGCSDWQDSRPAMGGNLPRVPGHNSNLPRLS